MGLEGYLEDLGISEILQIISLSKKSGMLSLSNEQETGTITFLEGQVVRATSTRSPETLGRLLIQHNIVTAQQVEAALVRQSGLRCHQPLGAILAATCQVPPAAIEAIVKQQIEEIVSGFFTWDKGHFSFQLGEPQAFGSTSVNPFDFMLEKGISSPRLVVKGRHFAGHRDGVDDADDAVLEAEIEFLEKRLDDEGLMLLRGMLAELEYSSMGSGIILLILRYASEIMNRAIIFDVRGRQLVGLGQFGLTGLSTAADELVRELRLDVEPDSLFSRALQEKNVLCSALEQSVAEQMLSKILGGVPDEVFLGPLVSDGKVVAMLYGDNYPDNGPIKAATTFGIFLSQAGLAMEQALQDQ